MALKFNPKAPTHKKWLAKAAKNTGVWKKVDTKGFKWYTPYIGEAARRVIRGMQLHYGDKPDGFFRTDFLGKLYADAYPNKFRLVDVHYNWNGALGSRYGKPPGVVWHHSASAANVTPQTIHSWHLLRSFRGIGYHFVVTPTGNNIYRGRPEDVMGAHCLGHNDMLGVCAVGDFQHNQMPAKQVAKLVWLKKYLDNKYSYPKHYRHLSLNATSCPGRYYPWDRIK